MKKKFILFLVLGLILIGAGFVAHFSFAGIPSEIPSSSSSSSGGIFGGKIANTKAERIEELEGEMYNCNVSGSTIEVTPISVKGLTMPYSYVIPSDVENKTGFSLRDGQWIIGKYRGKMTITCINDDPEIPPEYVELDKIKLYGTSKV